MFSNPARDAAGDLPQAYLRQSVLDAAARMRRGLFLYPAIWAVLIQVDHFVTEHLAFAAINGLCLSVATVARWRFNNALPAMLERDVPRTLALFRAATFLYTLYWGCLTAVVLMSPDAPNLRWMLLMATVGLASGGTVVLAMDDHLPWLFPLALLGPPVAAALHMGGAVNHGIAALASVYWAYAFMLSRMAGDDYWARQRAQLGLETQAAELRSISRTDTLTRVANRLSFEERLVEAWRGACDARTSIAVAIIDLDHFKRINDTHGHPFGDLCLQQAAAALNRTVRQASDMVARYGGEEFVVIMPGADLAHAGEVADRLLRQVAQTSVQSGAHATTLSCSIGVAACVPDAASGPDELIQCADIALYEAKQTGRGRVVARELRPASVA